MLLLTLLHILCIQICPILEMLKDYFDNNSKLEVEIKNFNYGLLKLLSIPLSSKKKPENIQAKFRYFSGQNPQFLGDFFNHSKIKFIQNKPP